MSPEYTLDGEPVDLAEFFADNPDLDEEDRARVAMLGIGEQALFGGGAFALSVLERVA